MEFSSSRLNFSYNVMFYQYFYLNERSNFQNIMKYPIKFLYLDYYCIKRLTYIIIN